MIPIDRIMALACLAVLVIAHCAMILKAIIPQNNGRRRPH